MTAARILAAMPRPLRVLSLAAAAAMLPISAAVAGPPCDVRGAELAGGTLARIVVGEQHVQGYVLRQRLGGGRSCVIAGAGVELLARTANTSETRVVRTGTTDSNGRVEFAVRPLYTTVLQARLTDGSVQSAAATIRLATRISAYSRTVAANDCRVRVHGRTFPAKPGSIVTVDGGIPEEQARARVAADGTYAAVVASSACGGGAPLVVSIGRTYRNDSASSNEPRPVAARVAACSTFSAGEGPAQPGLTLALELFNTTARPHGVWAGEVVVANPTSEAQTYKAEDGFSLGEPYRVLLTGSSSVVSSEDRTDGGSPPASTTLQPGEEKRVPVSLRASNCPRAFAFGTAPGDGLPPGTYEVVAVKRVDDGRDWSSARVPVTVASP